MAALRRFTPTPRFLARPSVRELPACSVQSRFAPFRCSLKSPRPTRRAVLLAGLTAAGSLLFPQRATAETWAVREWVGQIEVRSEVAYDGRLAEAIAELAPLRAELERTFGLTFPNSPIELNVFASRRTYTEYLSVRVPGGASRAALFVDGVDRDRVYTVNSRQVGIDVRHECTHAFLHSRLPYVPLWLDEGLAEYFEVPSPERIAGHTHLRTLRRPGFVFWRPNLQRLEALRDLADMGADEYREAWAWTHFMLNGPQPARAVLQRYVASIAAGDFSGKLHPQLAAAVGDPEAALKKYVRQIR